MSIEAEGDTFNTPERQSEENTTSVNPLPEATVRLPIIESVELVPAPEKDPFPTTAELAQQVIIPVENPPFNAVSSSIEERVATFNQQKTQYEETLATKFNDIPISLLDRLPPQIASKLFALKNFTRLGSDLLLKLQSKLIEEDGLKNTSLEATVISRGEILDPQSEVRQLIDSVESVKDRTSLQALFEKEIFAEAQGTHSLMIRGTDLPTFIALTHKLGYNPLAFLSDPRGEKARLAIDNIAEDGIHPFANELATSGLNEDELQAEMALWGHIYPNSKIPLIKNWSWSRTHSLIYPVKLNNGETILFLPIHIDPENAVAAIAEKFGKKISALGESAMDFHRSITGTKGKYIGTGETELAIKYFLSLLEANNGLLKELIVHGEEKLDTTHTIIGDHKRNKAFAREFLHS